MLSFHGLSGYLYVFCDEMSIEIRLSFYYYRIYFALIFKISNILIALLSPRNFRDESWGTDFGNRRILE